MRGYRALDLFCGGGGAARGILAAGFSEVVGVDLAFDINRPKDRTPNVGKVRRAHARAYPGRLIIGDAVRPPVRVDDFDFVWASPPCQAFSCAMSAQPDKRDHHPNLIPATRALLEGFAGPSVIENVPGSPIRADVVLNGAAFDLDLVRYRHFELRGFECDFLLLPHQRRTVSEGELASCVGKGGKDAWGGRRKATRANQGRAVKWAMLPDDLKDALRRRNSVAGWRAAMQVDDAMTRDQIREAVPPAYAEFIARAALAALRNGEGTA